jgi:aryl-phospho-beta-D-glucosidase BglC (GH1 family)
MQKTWIKLALAILLLLTPSCDGVLVASPAPESPPAVTPPTVSPQPGPLPDAGTSGAESPGPSQAPEPPPASPAGYLQVDGNLLKDDKGQVVRLTGVNWFGFETQNRAPHGLWSRDYRSMLAQVSKVGFNALRLPWSNAILEPGAQAQGINFSGSDPVDGVGPMNAPLKGKTPLEILDAIIAEAKKQGLRVILDNHSRKPDAYMSESLWYTQSFSEKQWIQDWVSLAKRYSGDPTVVGFDLNNEPHGPARWGEGGASVDWKAAAERCGDAILKVNPGALIIVEGVEQVAGKSYWWGGNLAGVKDSPVKLSDPTKLVYSTHEYGPEVYGQTWFSDAGFPSNMAAIWRAAFGYVMEEKRGHVLVGEFGIKDKQAHGGKAGTWFSTFLAYAGSSHSWTFWCWNPNSGDTGGILKDDWTTVHAWKVNLLKPHMAPKIPAL